MKMRIAAPEVTVGGKKYQAGHTVEVENENEARRLIRTGYAFPVEEKAATPRQNKALVPENKEA